MSGGDFHTYAFAATGGTASRTMPDRLADIINVKDYGATGDGTTNDESAIQAAVDAAFGTAAAPNGTTATSNKPLFFPNGTYKVNTPIVLTKVRGAHIYGAGPLATTVTGASGAFITNGCEYCHFEDMTFLGGASSIAFELDWDGVGSVGLQFNSFSNVSFVGTPDYSCRIGLSGNGGAGNQFYACNFGGGAVAGLVTWTAGAFGQSIHGGGASQNVTAFWIKNGSISAINDVGFSGNTSQDVLMDSIGPVLLKGNRTESLLSLKFTNANSVATLDGHSCASSVNEVCQSKGKVILDSCTTDSANVNTKLNTAAGFTGSYYMRGCYFPQANFLVGFTGTAVQNI
jgi:hypothetical protein